MTRITRSKSKYDIRNRKTLWFVPKGFFIILLIFKIFFGCFVDIEFHPEGDTVFFVGNTAGVVVGVHCGLHDSKTDAGPTVTSCACFIPFVEAEPDFIQFIFGDVFPFVEDADAEFFADGFRGNGNLFPRSRVIGGVGDQVHQNLSQHIGVCQDHFGFYRACDLDILFFEHQTEFADDHMERLKIKLAQAEKLAWDTALKLRENRKETANILSDRILTELSQLDMPKVQFACQFTELDLSANGADAVAFFMSANVGEALKPMSKVASGGELARIMLAMKNVLAEQDKVNTLIFDEVDTGVSGRAAQKVAEKLKSVARSKQVLCVTHLPQLAAMGDTHLLIAKGERDGRTYTTVTPLDLEGRKRELARIIGGANITEITLKSAEEMLKS